MREQIFKGNEQEFKRWYLRTFDRHFITLNHNAAFSTRWMISGLEFRDGEETRRGSIEVHVSSFPMEPVKVEVDRLYQ